MKLLAKLKSLISTHKIKIILGIILSVLLFLSVKYITYLVNVHDEKKYELFRKTYADSIHYYADKHGDTVVQIFTKNIPAGEVTVVDKKSLDSMANVLNLKQKELDKYIAIVSQSDFSNATSKREEVISDTLDSLPVYHYNYQDRFIAYDAYAGDSLHFKKLTVYDSTYGFFTQRQIGDKTYEQLTLKNTNPHVKITGIESYSYEIPKEESKFSIGLSGGVNVPTLKPYIGIGINYRLIGFKKKIK